MKLDVNALRYLSKDEYRALQAIELGQKNVSPSLCCLAGGNQERLREVPSLNACMICSTTSFLYP